MVKRYFGKTTEKDAKHRRWTDGEMIMTAIHWKKWAREKGYVAELNYSNNKTFIIFNAMTGKTIKTLAKV